jgi:hypothetical protein
LISIFPTEKRIVNNDSIYLQTSITINSRLTFTALNRF